MASTGVLNRLRWNLTAGDFDARAKELISGLSQVLDRIAQVPAESRSFDTVVKPLADWEAESAVREAMLTFPRHVSPDSAVRDASTAAEEALEKFQIEAQMRVDVFKAVNEYAASLDEGALAADERRYLDFVLRDYRRNGLGLEEAVRAKNEQLSKRISELCIRIAQNVNDDDSHEWLTAAELDGLPDAVLQSLTYDAERKQYRVSMKYPEVTPALNYVRDAGVRARLDRTFKSRQQDKNVELVEEVLRLRAEKAALLGYRSSADYTLEICMAKNTELVDRFYAELVPRLIKKGRQELQVLSELKAKLGAGDDATIYSHDFGYYHCRLQESLGVDQEQIRQYFPLEHVVREMLTLYENLFSCRFEELPAADAWHPSVQYFKVYEAADGAELGAFYIDMFPRDGKFSHAACFPQQPRCLLPDGQLQKPVGSLVCNFTKPTADRPSLLKHSEVVTLFHEFGHMIHGLAATAKYARMSGTATERDFVECPSQMLENWCYVPSVLRRISKHHETGEPLPQPLIDSLVALKNLNSGLLNLRQVFFGKIDQALHRASPAPGSTQQLWHDLRLELTLIPECPGTNPLANFGHLFGGYDSRYYGYLWSQVYAAALFEKFEEKGFDEQGFCRDPTLGRRYRDEILAPGGSRDSLDSLRIFLGREPSVDPFLRSIGLSS